MNDWFGDLHAPVDMPHIVESLGRNYGPFASKALAEKFKDEQGPRYGTVRPLIPVRVEQVTTYRYIIGG